MMWRYTDDRYTGDTARQWHEAGRRMIDHLDGGSYFFFGWRWDHAALRTMAIPDGYINVHRDGAEVVLVCHIDGTGEPDVNRYGQPRGAAFTVGAWLDMDTPWMYWVTGGDTRPCPWLVEQPQAGRAMGTEPEAEPPLGDPFTVGDLPRRFRFPMDRNMHDTVLRVIATWPGACPAGRAEALHRIEQMRIDELERYEFAAIRYIYDRYPGRFREWCEACGIVVSDPEPTWFERGTHVRHTSVEREGTVMYDPRNPNTIRPAWLTDPLTDECVFVFRVDDSRGEWWHCDLITPVV